MRVRLTAKVPPYQAGEVADFPEDRARRLVTAGAAEFVDSPEPPVAPEVDPPAPVYPTRAKRSYTRKRG